MKILTACLTAGALAASVPLTGAQTLEANYLGTDPAITVMGVIDGDLLVDGPSGLVTFDVVAGFCAEPVAAITSSEPILYAIQDPATLAEVDAIQRIIGGYYASGQTTLDASGAQWAIWEVLGDGTVNPTFVTGMVRMFDPDSVVADRALEYINNLDSLPAVGLTYLTHPSEQDIVGAVPEPGVVAILVGMLAWFVAGRRR